MTHSPTISAVIISCNEADIIEPCLQSVTTWVDEIVVVDMHSTDGTREIVQRYPARLVDHEQVNYVEPVRNFALAQATGDWLLVLDPDERVPATLSKELRRVAREDRVDIVSIRRTSVIFGRIVQSLGAIDTGTYVRFFRKGTISWPAEVHGPPDTSGLRSYTFPPQGADMAIYHDTWRSIPSMLDKIVRYAPGDVKALQAHGHHFSIGRMLYNACGQFAHRMVIGRGYEDGMAGFLSAFYFAVYHLTIYAELWEAEGRPVRFDHYVQRCGRLLAWPFRLGIVTTRVILRFTQAGRGLLAHRSRR